MLQIKTYFFRLLTFIGGQIKGQFIYATNKLKILLKINHSGEERVWQMEIFQINDVTNEEIGNLNSDS